MCFEHEAMHSETLLYMLLQSPETLPPPGFTAPPWASLARLWDAQHARDQDEPACVSLGPTRVSLGIHDVESEDVQYPDARGWEKHVFGWDLENGKHDAEVGRIKMSRKPITNGEYKAFLESSGGGQTLPGSWLDDNGAWKVRSTLMVRFPPNKTL
jgi:formylglycine-generating enzyme required for sulfatase activity